MSYLSMYEKPIIIRGAGDLATGTAIRLFKSGFSIIMLEIETPTVIRRTVSFAETMFSNECTVEGVIAVKTSKEDAFEVAKSGKIAVCVDPDCSLISEIEPKIVIDAILAKKNLGTNKNMAPFTIALGPGFEAGRDVDVVVETQRGHKLGTLIYSGKAEENTGIPGIIGGVGKERVIHTPCEGIFKSNVKIGDLVEADSIVAFVDSTPVYTEIAGKVRGMLHDGLYVPKGFKVADVDPRGASTDHTTCSDKARAIAGGVLEAVMHYFSQKDSTKERRIYLDNAATSYPKAPGLGQVMASYIEEDCVNINRTESKKEGETFSWLYDLREKICTLYNSDNPECVVFTKNVTESLNWVLKGFLSKGDTVAVSSYEHNSVMRPLTQLGVKIVTIDKVDKNTKAIVVNAASNVTGRIENLDEISVKAKENNCYLIIDAAQATPHINIDMKKLNADAVCFTGHKGLLGPQGTGGFVMKKSFAAMLNPLLSGGTGTQSDSFEIPSTMPEKFTCGTENLVGLKGLYHSVCYVLENNEKLEKKNKENTEYLYEGLSKIKGISIIGPDLSEPRTDVISIISDMFDVADLAAYLSNHNVETRVGLHCSPLAHKTIGTYPIGSLRFSPGPFNTKEELDRVLELIREFIKL